MSRQQRHAAGVFGEPGPGSHDEAKRHRPDPTAEGAIRSKHYECRKNPNSIYAILNRPDKIQLQIRGKLIQAAALRSCLGPQAITYDKDKVQTTPQDKMSDIMAQIDDLDSDIDYLKDQLRSSRREIAGLCEQYLDDQETRIVKLRHIDGLKWDDVARAVHRSERTVHRIHKSAVDKLKEYNI